MDNKTKVLILVGDDGDMVNNWIIACKKYSVDYSIGDVRKSNWVNHITDASYILAAPPGNLSYLKQYYDECVTIAVNELGKFIYPTITEILLYENKRMQSLWMNARNIPHPKTYIYYDKGAAEEFIEDQVYPIVAKTNIGAAGSGVRILKTRDQAQRYINLAFSEKGAPRRYGPNFRQGNKFKRYFGALLRPDFFVNKFKKYNTSYADKQKWFVLFQEYIPHNFEWRVVRIGDSYFAHKKIKSGDKASGSKIKVYCNPPLELLDFVRNLCEENDLRSQAVDIFQTNDGSYLVNELQTIFGQSDPYQMLVDDKPGRYLFRDNSWQFEEGDFATNNCFDLRLLDALSLIDRYAVDSE